MYIYFKLTKSWAMLVIGDTSMAEVRSSYATWIHAWAQTSNDGTSQLVNIWGIERTRLEFCYLLVLPSTQ